MSHYVHRHGRRIEIETVEIPGTPAPQRSKRKDAFVQISLEEVATEFSAIKCPTTMVWLALRHERWRLKSNTVRLPAALLRSWGLNRFAWMRALARIEQAGLARVERHSGRAARVTFTSP